MPDLTRDLDALLRDLPTVRNQVLATAVAGNPDRLRAAVAAACDQVTPELLCCELYSVAAAMLTDITEAGGQLSDGFLRDNVVGDLTRWPDGATVIARLSAGLERGLMLSDMYPTGADYDPTTDAFALCVLVAGLAAFWARIEAFGRHLDTGVDATGHGPHPWHDLHQHGTALLVDVLNGTSAAPDGWVRHARFGTLMLEELATWVGTPRAAAAH